MPKAKQGLTSPEDRREINRILREREAERDRKSMEMERLLDCRAGKLLREGQPFIVVAFKELYYPAVYRTIRMHEKQRGSWTETCESEYQKMMQLWANR